MNEPLEVPIFQIHVRTPEFGWICYYAGFLEEVCADYFEHLVQDEPRLFWTFKKLTGYEESQVIKAHKPQEISS